MGEGRAAWSSLKGNTSRYSRWDGRSLAASPVPHAWERQLCHQIITFCNVLLINRLNNGQKERGELRKTRREGGGKGREIQLSSNYSVFHFIPTVPSFNYCIYTFWTALNLQTTRDTRGTTSSTNSLKYDWNPLLLHVPKEDLLNLCQEPLLQTVKYKNHTLSNVHKIGTFQEICSCQLLKKKCPAKEDFGK